MAVRETLDKIEYLVSGASHLPLTGKVIIDEEKLTQMIQYQAKEKDTQFIVVSLRKPMFESSDRMIGVTQKNKGVTQVTGIPVA